jgi:hypothetical protein
MRTAQYNNPFVSVLRLTSGTTKYKITSPAEHKPPKKRPVRQIHPVNHDARLPRPKVLDPPISLLRGQHDRHRVVENETEQTRSRSSDTSGLGSQPGRRSLCHIGPTCTQSASKSSRISFQHFNGVNKTYRSDLRTRHMQLSRYRSMLPIRFLVGFVGNQVLQ